MVQSSFAVVLTWFSFPRLVPSGVQHFQRAGCDKSNPPEVTFPEWPAWFWRHVAPMQRWYAQLCRLLPKAARCWEIWTYASHDMNQLKVLFDSGTVAPGLNTWHKQLKTSCRAAPPGHKILWTQFSLVSGSNRRLVKALVKSFPIVKCPRCHVERQRLSMLVARSGCWSHHVHPSSRF